MSQIPETREPSEPKEHTMALLFQGLHFGKYCSGRGESERKPGLAFWVTWTGGGNLGRQQAREEGRGRRRQSVALWVSYPYS